MPVTNKNLKDGQNVIIGQADGTTLSAVYVKGENRFLTISFSLAGQPFIYPIELDCVESWSDAKAAADAHTFTTFRFANVNFNAKHEPTK